jgi:hypothetical protein
LLSAIKDDPDWDIFTNEAAAEKYLGGAGNEK